MVALSALRRRIALRFLISKCVPLFYFFLSFQTDGGLLWKVVAMVTPGAGGEDSDSMTTDSHSPPSPWPPFIVCPVVSAAAANRRAAPLTLREFGVGLKLKKTSIRPLDGGSHNG